MRMHGKWIAMAALAASSAWADGAPGEVEWLTDYPAAIQRAQETGRLLLIYNGWSREGV